MTRHVPRLNHTLRLAPLAAALAVAGCGGGGGGGGSAATTVTGSIVKGPVNGAQVCAYTAIATGKGTQLGCTTTTAGGTYSLQVAASGSIVIEATGGTYTDEATGSTRTLSDPMQVVVGAGSGGGTVTGVVTPLTSVAYAVSRGGTAGVGISSFNAALGQVTTAFGLTGVDLATAVPAVASGTTDPYGRMLRAVSQYIANGGTLARLLALSAPGELQTGLQAAYLTINGSNITLNLPALQVGTGTGSNSTPGSTAGGLTITFASSGLGSVPVPSVTVPGIPAPAPGTFCSGLSANDANLAALKALGTLTINSCTASGNTYTVAMTVAATGFTLPYTVTYAYN